MLPRCYATCDLQMVSRSKCSLSRVVAWAEPSSPVVNVNKGLVPHVERAHHLEGRDLQREVEGRDDGHRPIRPPQPRACLACMVSRHAERAGHETHLRTHTVLVKVDIDQCIGAASVCWQAKD